MSLVDVIVVGAGPAGARCAFRLASLGRNVILLDSAEDIGRKVCTGIVSAECAERFDVPGDLVLHEGRKLSLTPPFSDAIKLSRDEPPALVIDRAAFIQSIADKATDCGAQVRLGHRVTDVRKFDTGVEVTACHDDESVVLRARSVVIASGFGSHLVQKMGLELPGAVAYGVQAKAELEDLDETILFARGVVPKSFFGWVVPRERGSAYIGLLGRDRPMEPFLRMVDQLRERIGRFELTESPRAWGVPLRASRRSYSDRCLSIGDAAGHIKPTTGGGIYYALIAADIAADVLSDSLERDDLSKKSLKRYQSEWREAFGREIRLGYISRLFYESMDDRDLDRILLSAADSGLFDGEVSFDQHSRFVIKAMRSSLFMSVLKAAPRVAARMGSWS